MAKKQLSFAEKANRIAGKSDWKYVKYVKSVRSEKTDRWRFNEQIITLQGNESLDDALKRMDESRLALDINLPDFSKTEKEEEPAVAEAVEETAEAAPEVSEEANTAQVEETEEVSVEAAPEEEAPAQEESK